MCLQVAVASLELLSKILEDRYLANIGQQNMQQYANKRPPKYR